MAYLYETHLHTCQGSACGRSTGREHARFYKDIGYQGIIVTDHFFGGNSAVPRTGTWRERIEQFCSGYEDALAEGQRIGLDVFFGWEQGNRGEQWDENSDGDEYLIYGLTKQWLLQHPEMEHWTRRQQFENVHRFGGCVIQAHPFRDRYYINQVLLGRGYCDGIEAANAGNAAYNDAYAMHYAKEYGLFTMAGSDNHRSGEGGMTADRLMGVWLETPLKDITDWVRIVRGHQPVALHVPMGRFDVCLADTPDIATYWLDEHEHPIPTGRHWLHGECSNA